MASDRRVIVSCAYNRDMTIHEDGGLHRKPTALCWTIRACAAHIVFSSGSHHANRSLRMIARRCAVSSAQHGDVSKPHALITMVRREGTWQSSVVFSHEGVRVSDTLGGKQHSVLQSS